MYQAPGHADQLDDKLLARWNEAIKGDYDLSFMPPPNRFFTLDWAGLDQRVATEVRWSAAPAELGHCLPGEARELSDWSWHGRIGLQNEYAEYHVTHERDHPKRVVFTTELREYWLCLAVHDPDLVRRTAESVLGFEPTWDQLYGVGNPHRLRPDQREAAFISQTAGPPATPEDGDETPKGPLNREHLLFMTHPINGLDDLLYIVRFGAVPFARRGPQGPERASTAEIFLANPLNEKKSSTRLFCRNADPEAAAAAHGAAFEGRTVAFRDPLGVYIRPFDERCLRLRGDGGAVPEGWVRWRRGVDGMYQRLEVGPEDGKDGFLDDLEICDEATVEPLTGGFQLARQLEVGPLLWVGDATLPTPDEYRYLPAATGRINCREAIGPRCGQIEKLRVEFSTSVAGQRPES